jgi:hypothetical protein
MSMSLVNTIINLIHHPMLTPFQILAFACLQKKNPTHIGAINSYLLGRVVQRSAQKANYMKILLLFIPALNSYQHNCNRQWRPIGLRDIEDPTV